jgi:hypothetical protein
MPQAGFTPRCEGAKIAKEAFLCVLGDPLRLGVKPPVIILRALI